MNIANLKQDIELDRNLHVVFAELFLYNFLGQPQDHTDLSWQTFLADGVTLLGSDDTLWASIATVWQNASIGKETYEIKPGGYFYYPPGHRAGDVFNGFPAGILKYHLQSPGGPRLNDGAFAAVRELASVARRSGIDLRFIATPNHAYFDYYLDVFNMWGMVEEWLRRLSSEVVIYSFSQPNDWVYETVRPVMKYWNDPIHFSLAMGAGIQASLAGREVPDLPSNFMMRLTPDNVAAHVESRRRAIERWAKEHPAFVEEFEQARRAALRLPPLLDSKDFQIGEEVTQKRNQRYLTMIDGTRIVLENRSADSNDIFGAVEGLSFPPLTLTGWAIDPDAKKPARVVGIVNNRVWANAKPTMDRPDIAGGFGSAFAKSGFAMSIADGSADEVKQMRAYAVMQDGTARELNYAAGIGSQAGK